MSGVEGGGSFKVEDRLGVIAVLAFKEAIEVEEVEIPWACFEKPAGKGESGGGVAL